MVLYLLDYKRVGIFWIFFTRSKIPFSSFLTNEDNGTPMTQIRQIFE